jgi:hypothetical protein
MKTLLNFCFFVLNPNTNNVKNMVNGGGKNTYKLDWKQLVYGNGYNPSNFLRKH